MKKYLVICLGILFLIPGVSLAGEKIELQNEMDRINYSIGYQMGGDFQRQGWKFNSEIMNRGILDALHHTEPLMPAAQMNATLVSMKKKLVADQQSKMKEADREFLEANAKKEGVVVLPSGVQYKVLREGSGKKPDIEDNVTIRSRASRVNELETASDYSSIKPKTYPMKKALPGLQEALQLMKEGSVWQIVLTPGPAMGVRGESLEKAGVLVYELELLSVHGSSAKPPSK